MTEMLKFEHPKDQSNIIKVIGVGGGGSNAVTHMYHQGIKGVDFVLCNTDSQALDTSPVPNKVHLGKRQLGAGNVPSVGRDAAIETTDELKELLEPHTKMLFITAGMGGGTGTGAAPVVAKIARELDILTVGIVTLPFSFEGKKRRQQAIEGIEELRRHVDTLLIISNDKLREEYGNMRLTEAFKKADDVLTIASKGIAEIITVTGYINVDFEDVKTVMKNSGKAIMGSAIASGDNRALKAIEEAMRSPLLNDSNISGAKNILLYITSGEEEISLDEVHEITDYIQHICGNSAEVIWGNGVDNTLENNIALTIIATGFENEETISMTANPADVKVRQLYDDNSETASSNVGNNKPTAVKVFTIGNEEDTEKENEDKKFSSTPKESLPAQQKIHQLFEEPAQEIIEFEALAEEIEMEEAPLTSSMIKDADDIIFEVVEPKIEARTERIRENIERIIHDEDSIDRLENERRSMERQNRLKAMSMKIKTDQGLEELEKIPAYMRKGTDVKQAIDTKETSRYSIDSTTGRPGLRLDNPFLHDNVD
ncbi:MAG: cell division protein FtsZ [Bacteroidales bacterium]|jgi:cell division protein FtsZ|nr:cell division protein FtsZ [Bacteroidales bacterium]